MHSGKPKRATLPLLAACLLAALLPVRAFAETLAVPITTAELSAWRDAALETMRGQPVLNNPEMTHDPNIADTWLYAFSFGMAELTEPQLFAPRNQLASVELLTDFMRCPRGIAVGDPMEAVLAAYPNENEAFAGDRSYAALYLREGGEDEGYGLLLRNGQTPECLQYVAASPASGMPDFFTVNTVSYVLDDGRVSSIRVEGLVNLVSDFEKNANFSSARGMLGRGDYIPEALESGPFEARDLFFSGLSFTTATQADCQRLFGEPLSYRDADGVRTMTYPELVVECDVTGGSERVDALAVMGGQLQGPRGIRVGDTQKSVVARFGGDPADTLTYTCLDADGQYYTLKCTFFAGLLTEFFVSRQ